MHQQIGEDLPEAATQAAADFERLLMTDGVYAADLFAPLEEQVIELARGDSLGSLAEPGPLARMGAVLFGLRPRRGPLADPRLEALRRAVVVACHRRHLPDSQAADLREQGFTAEQIRVLETRVLAS